MLGRWIAVGAACVLTACGDGGAPRPTPRPNGNLLAGLSPQSSVGARGVDRMTDGIIARPGGRWRTDLTARLTSGRAFVQYDLGRPVRVTALLLQGDNNDTYLLQASNDGETFTPVWRAEPDHRAGMRVRSAAQLDFTARYLRLSARGGDGSYSVGELQVFERAPRFFPPRLPTAIGESDEPFLFFAIGLFGALLILLALLTFREAPRWWQLLMSLPALVGAVLLAITIYKGWPIGGHAVSFLRATVAAVALVVVAREAFAPRLFRASPPVTLGLLTVCAALATAAFFNLGHPQFWDHRDDTPTAVHTFDMRVYYPVAKYFPELRFDGVYLASVAAAIDDDPAETIESLARVRLRDLKDHRMKPVAQVAGQVHAIRDRFTPERWEALKRDMRFFRTCMGPAYHGSMRDHGGNATPFWLAIAHLLFAGTEASEGTLLATALLDPLLLLFAFIAIGRTFGWRAMLVSLVVFGANDFYMFGSNWVGATLRHDWMAFLAFGICALKRERWYLAGLLLATAGMIRAFPAMTLFALLMPLVWWVWHQRRSRGAWPSRRELRQEALPLVKVYGAAAATVVVALLFSGAVLSFSAWSEWLHKVSLLNHDPHNNHVSLRLLFDGMTQVSWISPLLHQGLLALARVLGMAVLLLAARYRRPEQAALLGLFYVTVLLYPANYYSHFVFLLPLLATVSFTEPLPSRSDAGIWMLVLAICVAQYGTVGAPNWGIHFGAATVILLVAAAGMMAILILRDRARQRRPAAEAP